MSVFGNIDNIRHSKQNDTSRLRALMINVMKVNVTAIKATGKTEFFWDLISMQTWSDQHARSDS